MEASDAARYVAEQAMAKCRVEQDEVKADLYYEIYVAFRIFADLVEKERGEEED